MIIQFLLHNVLADAFHAELHRYFRNDLRGGVTNKRADGQNTLLGLKQKTLEYSVEIFLLRIRGEKIIFDLLDISSIICHCMCLSAELNTLWTGDADLRF